MLKTIQSWGQKVLAFKKAYVEGRSGATAIEYGLIAAGIAIVIVATIRGPRYYALLVLRRLHTISLQFV
jgi:Flp pilus assembly pilin Flp